MVLAGLGPECPTVTQVLASGLGGCWSCGAPIRFEEGAAVAECRHCGSNAMIDGELRRRMLRVAAQRLSVVMDESERASLEALVAEDRADAIYGFGGKTPLPLAQTVIAIAVLGGLFAWLGMTGKLGTTGDAPTGWIAPTLIVATVAVTLAVALVFRSRAHRRDQAQRDLEAMTGRPLHRPPSAADRQRMVDELLESMADDESSTK
jgi:predicted RNA-binding Zn-ribbon protein involved in translation (DUF1610 family)